MSIFEKSQLELRSNPNVFLNPMENINQREITDWSEVTDGEYGYDRWMKIDANTKRQPVEDIGLLKETVYTLSYVLDGSTVSRQITSPASGHWHDSDLDVPIAATLMKLEVGSVATPFIPERPSDDLSRCQRYYWAWVEYWSVCHIYKSTELFGGVNFQHTLRRIPTTSDTVFLDAVWYHDGLMLAGVEARLQVIFLSTGGFRVGIVDTDSRVVDEASAIRHTGSVNVEIYSTDD